MAAKILLVEDDNNLREIYEARLQAEGYTIVTAKDGEEALVVMKSEHPDLVISDVMMPRISGFEMLDILRNTEGIKDTKVVMLTALGQADDKSRANSLGADRYLVKSQVTLEDIVKAAHELIEGPASIANAGGLDTATPQPASPPQPLTAPEMSSMPPMGTGSTQQQASMAAQAPLDPTPVSAIPVVPAPDPVAPPAVNPITPPEPVMVSPAADSTSPMQAPASPAATTSDPTTIAPNPQFAPQSPPVSTPAPVISTAATEADEQASVGSQIESFENKSEASASAQDDAVLAKAVSDLNASDTTTTVPSMPPAATPSTPAAEPSATPPTAQANTLQPGGYKAGSPYDSASNSSKKVIQPLQHEPKPGIHELLAREEAKDIMGNQVKEPATMPAPTSFTMSGNTEPTPVAPPHTVITPSQPGAPAANPQPHDFDPNNISL